MKKKLFAGMLGLMLVTAAVLGSAGNVHATAYQYWGKELPDGGSTDRPRPVEVRDKIWGYTLGGSLGNTLINGTLVLETGDEYVAKAYTDSNLNHDISYVAIAYLTTIESGFFMSVTTTIYNQGYGAYGEVSRSAAHLTATTAEGCHEVDTTFYGTFVGWTGNYFS